MVETYRRFSGVLVGVRGGFFDGGLIGGSRIVHGWLHRLVCVGIDGVGIDGGEVASVEVCVVTH